MMRADGQRWGVLFIATGGFYVRAAAQALEGIRRNCPGLEAAIATDLPNAPEAGRFDEVLTVTNPHRRSKVDMLAETPFDRTIYLDTDVRVLADLSEVLEVLERFDIALAHAHSRNKPTTNEIWNIPLPAGFPQFNGGVIAYRSNSKTFEFMRKWSDSFAEAGKKKDQVTLRELLWTSDLRMYVLPPEYNIRYARYLGFWKREEAAPKILHLARYHDFERSWFSRAKRRVKESASFVASAFGVLSTAMQNLTRPGPGRS